MPDLPGGVAAYLAAAATVGAGVMQLLTWLLTKKEKEHEGYRSDFGTITGEYGRLLDRMVQDVKNVDAEIVRIREDLKECHEANEHIRREYSIVSATLRIRAARQPEALIIINDKRVIEGWNPHATELFGYAEAEALGQLVDIIVPAMYREAHVQAIARLAKLNQLPDSGRIRVLPGRRKDGTECLVELVLAGWPTLTGMRYAAVMRAIMVDDGMPVVQMVPPRGGSG